MVFIYIQYIQLGVRAKIPFRMLLFSEDWDHHFKIFNIRPEAVIPKKVYEAKKLDRMEILAAEPFCDSADELIELFQDGKLVFSEREQFILLKAQFRNIGFNFNLNPIIVWPSGSKGNKELEALKDTILAKHPSSSVPFAKILLEQMYSKKFQQKENLAEYKAEHNFPSHQLSKYQKAPGVYFFRNNNDEVIYVGKAKSIRKRLQSHFSNASQQSAIDYYKVQDIDVIYTGNDVIAQLIETENIKRLQPIHNTQQINNSAPYIISLSSTASGISKIKITRKVIEDSLPEQYFNRRSVVQSLKDFCNQYDLCRKHCGIETVKGPCSKVSKEHRTCVCSKEETIEAYNKRFQKAFEEFRRKTTRKIYKLKGRTPAEDAFIYEVNGIYQGYGYIDKWAPIYNYNDVLGSLISQENNYETARIISSLVKLVPEKQILELL